VDFKNRTVLITGASSGIGKQTAIEFAKQGANIILVARRKEKLDELASELEKFNIITFVCQCDVSDKAQVKEMSKNVLEKFDSIDILVNNAGFAIYGSVKELSIDEIESQMETNYFGMMYCIKNFLPSMLDKKSGHIVNVASVAASFGLPGIASYCASKFAMLGFSEGLKHELHGTGVGVTVVSPIMVRTDFFDHPSFEKMPKYSPTSLSSKTVAKAILKASNSPRLEIIVPSVVRSAVWLKHTFPYFINPILGKSFKKQLDAVK
jgi:short-subunit dehydrogenase